LTNNETYIYAASQKVQEILQKTSIMIICCFYEFDEF